MNRTVQGGNPMQRVMQVANMMRGKNPQEVAMAMMQQSPAFSQFMQSVQGKTPEQFSAEHGIDFNFIKNLLR